jgi:hypothetical protein
MAVKSGSKARREKERRFGLPCLQGENRASFNQYAYWRFLIWIDKKDSYGIIADQTEEVFAFVKQMKSGELGFF